MLNIKNLHAGIEEREILKGINLEIKPVKFMLLWGLTVPESLHFLLLLQERRV